MKTPRIAYSSLSGRWFVVTRFRTVENIDPKTGKAHRLTLAATKYDVTDQMTAILTKTVALAKRQPAAKRLTRHK